MSREIVRMTICLKRQKSEFNLLGQDAIYMEILKHGNWLFANMEILDSRWHGMQNPNAVDYTWSQCAAKLEHTLELHSNTPDKPYPTWPMGMHKGDWANLTWSGCRGSAPTQEHQRIGSLPPCWRPLELHMGTSQDAFGRGQWTYAVYNLVCISRFIFNLVFCLTWSIEMVFWLAS